MEELINYLGIDWGEKRIGLAIGSVTTRMAIPYEVVSSIEEIVKIIDEKEIDSLVIGRPVKMSGDTHNLNAKFHEFIEFLEDEVDIPIKFVDERLTSKMADARNVIKGTNKKDIEKASARRDAVAAMEILQSYFDQL